MSLEKISVPAHISEVIQRLEEKGFEIIDDIYPG